MRIIQTDGTYKLMLCMNCCQAAAYAETSGVGENDPEPLSKLPADDYVIVDMDDGAESDDSFGPECEGCGVVGVTRYPATGTVDGIKAFRPKVTTGFICKRCGEPSPVGVGYKSTDPTTGDVDACPCGWSTKS